MILKVRQMEKTEARVLMTPFFSKRVCQARVRSRKFIHIGRMKIRTMKLALASMFDLLRIMARG